MSTNYITNDGRPVTITGSGEAGCRVAFIPTVGDLQEREYWYDSSEQWAAIVSEHGITEVGR